MAKKFFLFLSGSLLLLGGIAWVLMNWESTVMLFKGVSGMVLAVTGLIILSFINDDKHGGSPNKF